MSGYGITLIKVDGGNGVASTPPTSSIGVLYPGERIEIMLERLSNIKDAIITIKLDNENLKFKNFALTPIQHFSISSSSRYDAILKDQDLVPYYNLAEATSPEIKDNTTVSKADQTILLYTKVEILAQYSYIPKGFINRTSREAPRLDIPPMIETNRQDWDNRFIPRIQPSEDGCVDIVLNNMDEKGHPFHLHWHSFCVLATHKGQPGRYQVYNPFTNTEPAGGLINVLNPIRKDTVYVPGMGYVVLRFRPDNEGVWLFHCHVLWHHAVGMAMAFLVGGDERGIPKYLDGKG